MERVDIVASNSQRNGLPALEQELGQLSTDFIYPFIFKALALFPGISNGVNITTPLQI
jgi:hypothetical protein